jgi:RimJ/RimL family protein N-acetyltransferase
MVVDQNTDIGIGITSLMQIDWRNRHAWHGIMIGDKEYHGKGFAYDAIFTTMRYAFDELQLARLDGGMIEYNKASLRLYSKLGWEQEGIRRKWIYRRGRFWDQVLTGITVDDYRNLDLRTQYWSGNV